MDIVGRGTEGCNCRCFSWSLIEHKKVDLCVEKLTQMKSFLSNPLGIHLPKQLKEIYSRHLSKLVRYRKIILMIPKRYRKQSTLSFLHRINTTLIHSAVITSTLCENRQGRPRSRQRHLPQTHHRRPRHYRQDQRCPRSSNPRLGHYTHHGRLLMLPTLRFAKV